MSARYLILRRILRHILLGAMAVALTATLAGCDAAAEAGHGATVSRPVGSSDPSAGALCPQATFADQVTCISASLSRFWSAELGRRVVENVVVDPVQNALPRACRGVPDDRAFTCGNNLTVYFGAGQRALITTTFAGRDRVAALAWVLGHEMGHIVQFTVHDPLIEARDLTAAESREVEQQADCLSGVWVAALAHGSLDEDEYRRDAVRLITLISDPAEVQTHGSPARRAAAVERGLTGRTPQACGLTVTR